MLLYINDFSVDGHIENVIYFCKWNYTIFNAIDTIRYFL